MDAVLTGRNPVEYLAEVVGMSTSSHVVPFGVLDVPFCWSHRQHRFAQPRRHFGREGGARQARSIIHRY